MSTKSLIGVLCTLIYFFPFSRLPLLRIVGRSNLTRKFLERISWNVSNDRSKCRADRFISLTQLGKKWLVMRCSVGKKHHIFLLLSPLRHLVNTMDIIGYQFWKKRFREFIGCREPMHKYVFGFWLSVLLFRTVSIEHQLQLDILLILL